MTKQTQSGRLRGGRPFQLFVQVGMLRMDGLAEVSDTPETRELLESLAAEPGIATAKQVRYRTAILSCTRPRTQRGAS